MAGSNTGFDADAFKAGIYLAMEMGSPNATVDKATFYWITENTYDDADNAGAPWDWGATPVVVDETSPVVLDRVALEFIPRSTLSQGNAVGSFNTPRAVITVLDDEWDQIEGFDYCEISGNRYGVDYIRPKLALFEVDVVQVELVAVDES